MQNQTTKRKLWLSLIVCIVLIAAMALMTTGCDTPTIGPNTTTAESGEASTPPTVVGEGATVFTFKVVDLEGKETAFEVHTDKTVVGEALLELELIAEDSGRYGLYVKTVNGETIDPDKDGAYWAFYINGSYAMTGVSSTAIQPDTVYTFKTEKL